MAQLRAPRKELFQPTDEGRELPSRPERPEPMNITNPGSSMPRVPPPPPPPIIPAPEMDWGAPGAGTSTRPREGSVGSGQAGGAGARSIVSGSTVAPISGGSVGVQAAPQQGKPGEAPMPTLIPPPAGILARPQATFDLFGRQGGSNMFGRAGGLQGGGLGVPSGGGADTNPSALIEMLLKKLGGR